MLSRNGRGIGRLPVPRGWRGWILIGLHLLILWGFAFADPLFQLLWAEFFFAVTPKDALLFAFAWAFLPPLALLVLLRAVALASAQACRFVLLATMAMLTAVFASRVFDWVANPASEIQTVVALVAGGAATALYVAYRPVRSFLTWLAPAPFLFLGAFVFFSPVSEFLLATEDDVRIHAPRSTTPVVLLVLDELPVTSLMDERQQIDKSRYPGFAKLAREATWFRNATTIHEETQQAVPAIFSGRRSEGDASANTPSHPDNVFTMVGGSYRINKSESASDLCPERLCPFTTRRSFRERMGTLLRAIPRLAALASLPKGISLRLFPPEGEIALLDPKGQFESWLPAVRGRGGRALHLAHLLLPHQPWHYLPSGRDYPRKRTPEEAVGPVAALEPWPKDPLFARQAQQRHLLQTMFTDRVVGRLLARLRRTGLYHRALLIVVADHGISFNPGEPPRNFRRSNATAVLGVPLFVKMPRQTRGGVDDRVVKTVDVLPTIADALDMKRPFKMDGRSLLDRRYLGHDVLHAVGADHELKLRVSEYRRERRRLVRRNVSRFGVGTDGAGLFHVGAGQKLAGRKLSELQVLPPRGARAEVDGLREVREVDLSSPRLRARITGRVSGLDSARTPLALALNDRVVASTRTHARGGKVYFSALLPEGAFRDGRNSFDIFAIHSSTGRARLRPVRTVQTK